MKQRYLITGGAGFIGSHLAGLLLERGQSVYVLDDESTGSPENIAHLRNHPDFHYVKGSITDDETLAKLMGTCHLVAHLAAAVGVQYILDNPLSSIMTNVAGTERVLHYCAQFEKPVFLASSSEVYGLQTKAPLREDDSCVMGPTSVSRWSYARHTANNPSHRPPTQTHKDDGLLTTLQKASNNTHMRDVVIKFRTTQPEWAQIRDNWRESGYPTMAKWLREITKLANHNIHYRTLIGGLDLGMKRFLNTTPTAMERL